MIPHDDDDLVIIVATMMSWNIKQILVEQGNLTSVLL